MKAKEWVAKLQQVPEAELPVEERFAEFLKEYGEETAKLVADRTKTSKPESRLGAADGAVREQRNKFRSICSSFPTLTDAMFDAILSAACPDYLKWVAAAQKKTEEDKKKTEKQDVADYRKNRFGGGGGKPKPRYNKQQQQQQNKPTEKAG
jgi:hypothetical protein